MVNLVKDYTNNQPLMEGHGAFSSVLGDTAAAMRYCITGDTLLLNSDSSLVKFKDIIEQSEEGTYNLKGKVLDFNGNEVNYSKYFNSGKHPVKRITLANGYEIKGTDNHPLLIIGINEKGEPSLEWKLIGDISYDDSIIIKRNNFNIPEVDKFNKLLAIFYGGMVAEGYISGEKQNYSRTGFSNQDKDYVDSVLDGFKILLTDSEFQKITRINPNKTSGSVYVIESHNTGLRNHLLEENFGINSYEREIPNKILNEGIGMHKWFLSSLFEGDGSVTTITTKTGNKEGSIDLHSVSLKLLKQVQVMLLNFNIISSITKSREAFRLQINKERDQINFKDKIGFLSKRKNESLNSLINSRSKNKKVKGVSMNDNIPYLSHFIRKNSVNKIREINRRAIGSYEKFNENLDLIKSSLNDQETLMNLEDFTNTVKDYSFFKVKEIKNLDQKETVYSIKVDSQDHSFLANGFINHNTEARLNKFSENYLLEDVNNNVVDMKPTFDSEDIEPVTLPAKLPLIFINGITGIGAGGFASSFPPHHTEAVINSTIALLKDNKVTVKDLIHKYNLKPAFPYGGYVDISNIEKIYSTGTGTFTTRATIERDTESDKKYDLLIVKDLPFLVTLESITNQIKEIHNDPKLKDHEKFLGLQDMQDQSHNVDIRLVLKYKKGTNLDLAIKSLYSKTSLQNFISFNPNMIKDENTLVEYTNVKDIFLDWIEFRKKTVKRSKMNKVRELERRIHILEAIIKIFRNKKNTDRFLEIVRTSPNRKETYDTLKKEFSLNNVQSEYLTNLRVYNINQFESSKYEDELAEKKIATEEEISYLKDDKKLVKFIIKELEEIRDSKHVKKPEYETKYYTQDPLSNLDSFQVPDTPYTMVFTNEGLLKKVESDVDKVQGRNGKGVSLGKFRDSDAVLTVFNASNRDNILLATADGYLYTYKVHEFPSSNRIANLGNDITSFTKGQQIINAFPLTDEELNGDKLLIVSTNDGYIKAIDLNEFTNSSRNGLLMLKLKNENSFVKSLDIIDKDQYEKATIIITKNDGTYTQYRLTDIPVLNRNTRGSSTYNNREDFELVGSHILLDDVDKYLLVVGEDGKGKLVSTEDLSVTNRPSSGQIIIGGRNLAYSTVLSSTETSDKESKLMIVSNKKTVTIPMLDISIYKRPAMGTMLKSLDADEKIVTCSPIV